MKTIHLFILLSMLFLPLATVSAQGVPVAHVVASTKPVLPAVREAVDALLAVSPPVPTVTDYVITYSKSYNPRYFTVSVAAADPYSENWHIEDARWWGSMELTFNGSGYDAQYTQSALIDGTGKMAAPRANGGSSSVRFPWGTGKSAMYGPRGVHGGAFGTSGMIAVDWVGGNDMGSNVMTDTLYASDAGTVDAVCEDGTSVGIRLHNSTTGEYFAYLHLVITTSIEEGDSFSRGGVIGTLRHGSFNDSCGWADQGDDHYHVHWGVMPASGSYQTEGCILNIDSQIWDCGDSEVAPNEMMYGGGGTSNGGDDPAEGAAELSFWDYLLSGAADFFSNMMLGILPTHEDSDFLSTITNGIVSIFAIAYVLTKGSYTLYPAFAVFGIILLLETIRITIIVIVIIIRLLKAVIPFL